MAHGRSGWAVVADESEETTGYFRVRKEALEQLLHPQKSEGGMSENGGKMSEWIWRGLSILISLILAPTAAWVWTSEARIAKLELEVVSAAEDLEALQEWSHNWEQTISTRPCAVSQETRPQLALLEQQIGHLLEEVRRE